jgi:hypothetical protein
MPLTRPVANPPVATPQGVRFTLADRSKLIHCVVTRRTLEKLVKCKLDTGEHDRVFLEHRDKIEAIASAKYDAAGRYYPPLMIQTSDLAISRRLTAAPKVVAS